MNEFQFEIFLRGFDRYSWRLVEREGDRRVLARAPVEFPTPLLARNSIMVMKDIVAKADIVTVGDDYGQVVGFEMVDAFPLRLKNTVSTHDTAAAADRPAAATAVRPASDAAPPEPAKAPADSPPAAPKATPPPKATTAGTGEATSDGVTPRKAAPAKAKRT